jgi:hypothetical protein
MIKRRSIVHVKKVDISKHFTINKQRLIQFRKLIFEKVKIGTLETGHKAIKQEKDWVPRNLDVKNGPPGAYIGSISVLQEIQYRTDQCGMMCDKKK